jgi:hypothetical protein
MVRPDAYWEATYRLRDAPEVVHAEPLFQYAVPEMDERATARPGARETHDPATDRNFEWSLEKANVISAWALFGSRPPGSGQESWRDVCRAHAFGRTHFGEREICPIVRLDRRQRSRPLAPGLEGGIPHRAGR